MTDEQTREAQLARIRALLARTTANGCTEAEAAAAAEAVDRLLEKYEINLDEVSVRAQEVVKFEITVARHPVRYACQAIAKFCDCMVWMEKTEVVFLGLELDTEVAEYLVMLMMRAVDRETSTFMLLNVDYAMKDSIGQSNMVHSFQAGLTQRLGERLAHMKSSRDFTQKSGGFDLVVSKGAVVKQAFGTLGLSLGKGSAGRTIADRGAYQAGRGAADGVAISQGVGRNASASNGRLR